ncbi:MAG: N-formylglutamate amidohydrolase, partial [Patescibacteria group bacterium]|nr:N-formylglutamate amidohydrolase [Patescibacteria group bacterium]
DISLTLRGLDFDHHWVANFLFVEVWKSTRPNRIIITVPHDVKPNYTWPDKPRSKGVLGGDPSVWLIAKDLIFEHEGEERVLVQDHISIVRGLAPRGVVDLNRCWPEEKSYYKNELPEPALENLRYAPIYRHFHSTVSRLIELAIEVYGREKCLLVDLHGFSKQPDYAPEGGYDLIFGTGNRQTILYKDVDRRMGEFLKECGYNVFVPEEMPERGRQEDLYAAEFITRGYSERFGVNAIQIETAHKFRDKVEGKEIGPKLSRDLVNFLDSYIRSY